MALTTQEMIKHHKSLIKLFNDFSKIERERKMEHSPKISWNTRSREICNAASIRIKCYDDFVQHLHGCITLMTCDTYKPGDESIGG